MQTQKKCLRYVYHSISNYDAMMHSELMRSEHQKQFTPQVTEGDMNEGEAETRKRGY